MVMGSCQYSCDLEPRAEASNTLEHVQMVSLCEEGSPFPTSVDEKRAFAKMLLGVNELHPVIEEAICRNQDDSSMLRYVSELDKSSSLSVQAIMTLADHGVIGQGTTPGASRFSYSTDYPPLIGIDRTLDRKAIFWLVGQTELQFSFDIPFASAGFSNCHAALIYDHTTSETAFIHVQQAEADPGQIDRIADRWAHSGKREIIYVYGSDSRHDSQEWMAHATGCTSIKTIQIATGSSHWSLTYNPNQNIIEIDRECLKEVLSYSGFSDEIYDQNTRRKNNGELQQHERIERSLYHVKWKSEFHLLNGTFIDIDFQQLTERISALSGEPLTPSTLKKFLLNEQLAFEAGDSLVIPCLFSKSEDSKASEINCIYTRAKHIASIECTTEEDLNYIYHRLLSSFGTYLWGADRFTAVIRREGEEIGIIDEGKTIGLLGDMQSHLYSDILQRAKEIHSNRNCKIYFTSSLGFISRSDEIVLPSPFAMPSL